MPINFVSGLPGHGKTLWLLARLKPEAERDHRPVFHNDIPGLNIPGWQPHPADNWMDLPPNSIMVIDEAQFVFPVRPRSAANPPHLDQLATHRHRGIDIWVISQHPTLLDNFVRKLVDRHFHVVRAFGTHNATIYEFPTGIENDPAKNRRREGVVLHKWRYPKEVFAWYKSSELHTVKRRIPMRVWWAVAAFIVMPVLFWYVWVRISRPHNIDQAAASTSSPVTPGQAASVPMRAVPPRLADAMSAQAYIDTFRPRIPGLAFTAPAYDALTKPVEAPYPSVCMYADAMPCRCWSQRGFRLAVPEDLCRQLAREPMDPYWLRRGERGFDRGYGGEGRSRDREGQAGVVPAVPAAIPVASTQPASQAGS